ncbi:MAG: ABC transporter permease [Chloroherpetonaceae bacterium]|nr:ABC transporter permease [Chthonomonadaceae bacterium]MDW8209220.1 ABC transporter permease [Chloroherpetonaceae bacterium]
MILAFVLKRLALAVPTLIVISFLTFVIARLAPSDPVDIIAGEKATPETRARIRHEYGLDRPILIQYLQYLQGIVTRGDFGTSFSSAGLPISRLIVTSFPVTAQLAVQALLFALGLGIPAGILAALYHNTLFDRITMALVVMLVSVPSIVLGPLLMLALAVRLNWLPVSGWKDAQNQIFLIGLPTPFYTDMVLPTVTLGARSAALIARFMRSSLLDTLRQDYLRTAIAKGFSRAQAVRRHALKNALLPVLTVVGTNFGLLLSGSFIVETLFQVPGIGFESINSVLKRDYPVIQGMALLAATVYILINLTVDILYGFVDPRVRSREAGA